MAIIDVRGLTYRYGRHEVLRDLDFWIPEGAFYALLGRNGVGKSTLLQILMGLRRAPQGDVRVLDTPVHALTIAQRATIGYVAEGQKLPGWMRLEQLEAYCAPLYPTWDRALADQLRDRFALDPRRRLRTMSRGDYMKAALLVSLAPRPRLLIMDEPFTGIDVVVKDELVRGLLGVAGGGRADGGHRVARRGGAGAVVRLGGDHGERRDGGVGAAGGAQGAVRADAWHGERTLDARAVRTHHVARTHSIRGGGLMPWHRQVTHVLAKDLREQRNLVIVHLALLIASTTAVVREAIFAPDLPYGLASLLFLAVLVCGPPVVAAAVLGDRPADPTSFWAGRPFYPSAVATSKLAFAAIAIGLPVLLAQ